MVIFMAFRRPRYLIDWSPLLGTFLLEIGATTGCQESLISQQTEIVFIGIDMDEAAIRDRLDACFLTGDGFEKGPESWLDLNDPLPRWDLSCDIDLD